MTGNGTARAAGAVELAHLDLVRAVALAANTSWAPTVAFEAALEVVCGYTGWPCGLVWDVERSGDEARLLPGAVWTEDGGGDGLRSQLKPVPAGSAGVLGALVTTASPASLWRLEADPAIGDHVPLGDGWSISAAFPVVVAGQVVAILQFFMADAGSVDRGVVTAMETVSLQLSRVVERAMIEAELRDREAQARQVMDRATDPFVSLDLDGVVMEWNRRAVERFGWTADEIVGANVGETLVPTQLAKTFADQLEQYRVQRSSPLLGRSTRMSIRDRSGRDVAVEAWVWGSGGRHPRLHAFLRPTEPPDGDGEELVPTSEVADDRDRERFLRVIGGRLGHDRWGVGVAVVQLDRFWRIRDELGPVASEDVLHQTYRRLEGVVAPGGHVARLDAAQFGVVASHAERDAQAQLGRRLLDVLRQPVSGPGYRIGLDANVGVVDAAAVDTGARELVQHATAALRSAQQRGAGRAEAYDPTFHVETAGQLTLEADLREAVVNNEVEVHYQPLIELATGRLSSSEALVRWRRPDQGLLAPNLFIPQAERTGIIHELGYEVLSQALRCTARWRSLPRAFRPTVAVNISPVQLEHDHLPGRIAELIEEHGLAPEDLTVEITESALAIDETLVVRRLWELHELGIVLSMDDFGTGYSSLSRLRALPFDVLKVDRSFLQHVTSADEEVPMLHAVTELARDLGMQVVAEGVETPVQLHAAIRYGCTHVQGYLFSRPVNQTAFERLLDEPEWDLVG